MPPQRDRSRRAEDPQSSSGGRRVCTALTTSGQPCKRSAVPGLTVCQSHGGGTAASVRAGRRASAASEAAVLWGISSDTRGLSVQEELEQLARNTLTDIIALRIKLGEDTKAHIGLLVASREKIEAEVGDEIYATVKTKRVSGTSPWVQELHKSEAQLIAVLRLLHEIAGDSGAQDIKRIRIQTAREVARLMKAFPGLTVDQVAAEVSRAS